MKYLNDIIKEDFQSLKESADNIIQFKHHPFEFLNASPGGREYVVDRFTEIPYNLADDFDGLVSLLHPLC